MTVTTGARGSCSDSDTVADSSRKASGSSSLAAMATWPSSSTTIMAVSWSSTWLMVTIWPSFIRCLMTSAALTDILCARSATLMVSGTWTSRAMNSCGAGSLRRSFCWLRPPRPPDLPPPLPPARQPSRLAGAAGLSAGFLREASSDQVEETSAVLMVFFEPGAPGLASFLAAPAGAAAVLPAGLCSVPDRGAAGVSGSGARSTLRGRFSISRSAAASASAARRASSRAALDATGGMARRVSAGRAALGAAAGSAFAGALAGSDLAAGCWACAAGAAACEEEDSDLVASTTGSGLASSALGSAGSVLTSGLASWATGSAGAGAGVDSDSGCAWTSGACS